MFLPEAFTHVDEIAGSSVKGIEVLTLIRGAFEAQEQLFCWRDTTLLSSPTIMAIAKPIRVLGLAAIGLWIFFLYQIFGPTKYPKGPGDTLKNMDRDPNLDRMHSLASRTSAL